MFQHHNWSILRIQQIIKLQVGLLRFLRLLLLLLLLLRLLLLLLRLRKLGSFSFNITGFFSTIVGLFHFCTINLIVLLSLFLSKFFYILLTFLL
mmetsp:Transcript_5567/g.496  ORF Transcript_5567/g.496 Transcript_5567/m.496 type:complete len:94 (+) Transcript_5567:152-433(+)